MAQAKTGDTVKVHYTGKLNDGTQFDSSAGHDPLQFTIGQGQMIPDFEQAIIGMAPGETKTIQIPSERAYGPHHEEMLMAVGREELPEGLTPQVGQLLEAIHPDGYPFIVKIVEVAENGITVDGNHPLAGKDLTFDIQLAEIA